MTAALVRGERDAFGIFHERVVGRLYLVLLRLARGREDFARDAVQDVMIRVLKHMKPFRTEAELWKWLRLVARSALIDRVRGERRWRAMESYPALEEIEALAAENGGEGEGLCFDLEKHLARLPAAERRIIDLYYFAGRNQAEIGREIGISTKALESRLRRIRRRLRSYLIEGMER